MAVQCRLIWTETKMFRQLSNIKMKMIYDKIGDLKKMKTNKS